MLAHKLNQPQLPTGTCPAMTPNESNPAVPAADAAKNENIVRVTNKLGTFEYDRSQAVHFPGGIVGFPDLRQFGIADLPTDQMSQFKLLQCLDEPSLCFIVLPADPAGCPIDQEDLQEACLASNISMENLALLFVITIRSMSSAVSMSINHRAPILVDALNRTARQYVLSNNKYSVQHILS